MRNSLQRDPSFLLWAPKSLQNDQKWPKMAPKGPHQYSMAKHCPTVSDFGPFRPLWAQKNGETGSKMTQTGPNPLALLGDHKSQGQFIGSTFSTFSHLFINRRNDLSQKLLGKNSHHTTEELYSFWLYHSAFSICELSQKDPTHRSSDTSFRHL